MERKSEFRFESLGQWFFPCLTELNGKPAGIPLEAMKLHELLRRGWFLHQPSSSREHATLSAYMVREPDREGFVVEIGVRYPIVH